jgi:hypothetical protein
MRVHWLNTYEASENVQRYSLKSPRYSLLASPQTKENHPSKPKSKNLVVKRPAASYTPYLRSECVASGGSWYRGTMISQARARNFLLLLSHFWPRPFGWAGASLSFLRPHCTTWGTCALIRGARKLSASSVRRVMPWGPVSLQPNGRLTRPRVSLAILNFSDITTILALLLALPFNPDNGVSLKAHKQVSERKRNSFVG